jgi:hypothetical protein
MKGEQLQNFVEHFLPDRETLTPGENYWPSTLNSNRLVVLSIGFAMDSEALAYSQWALRAWLRQGRLGRSPFSATGSGEDSSDDTLQPASPSREQKQRKLWAYRQRTAGWANPLKWTRPAFRRKLNPNFVDHLMNFPPCWTSVRGDFGPEAMALYLSAERSRLQSLCGESVLEPVGAVGRECSSVEPSELAMRQAR